MGGLGTYRYHDGRVDISRFQGGHHAGEGVRWTSVADGRTPFWLVGGKKKGQIEQREAKIIASKIGWGVARAVFLGKETKRRKRTQWEKDTAPTPAPAKAAKQGKPIQKSQQKVFPKSCKCAIP